MGFQVNLNPTLNLVLTLKPNLGFFLRLDAYPLAKVELCPPVAGRQYLQGTG